MLLRSLPSLAALLCLAVVPTVASGAIYQTEDEFGNPLDMPDFAWCEDGGGEDLGGGLVDSGAAIISYGVAPISFDDMSVDMQQWGLASAFYVIAMDAVLRGDEAFAASAAALGQTYVDSLIADGFTGDGVMDMAVAFEAYLDYGVMIIGEGTLDHDSIEWQVGKDTLTLTVDQATEILRGRAMVEPN